MLKTRYPGIYSRSIKRGTKTVYDATASHDYKQHWKRGLETLGEARQWQRRELEEMRKGNAGAAPSRMTLKDYLENRWLTFAQAKLKNARSRDAYRYRVDTIIEHLGDKRLTLIKTEDIDGMITALFRREMAQNTVRVIRSSLSASLTQAEVWGLIGKNPMQRVKAIGTKKRKPLILSIERLQDLFSAADANGIGMLIRLTVLTGMRWGEVTSLVWADIDFAERVIRLRDSKSPTGIRPIAIGPAMDEALQAYRLGQMKTYHELGEPPAQLVFTDADGTMMQEQRFNAGAWKRTREAVGLPTDRKSGYHFHDLRHVHATLLGKAGVHPTVAQRRLGHASVETTIGIYTDTMPGNEQELAAEAVEALITGHS